MPVFWHGAGKNIDSVFWFLIITEWRFVSLKNLIFWNIWRIFVLIDIWCWHLCCRCFLKYLEQIFKLALISVEGGDHAFNDGVGIWRIDCRHLPMLTFRWQKGAAADDSFGWRKTQFQCMLLDGENLVWHLEGRLFLQIVSWCSFSYFLFAI